MQRTKHTMQRYCDAWVSKLFVAAPNITDNGGVHGVVTLSNQAQHGKGEIPNLIGVLQISEFWENCSQPAKLAQHPCAHVAGQPRGEVQASHH